MIPILGLPVKIVRLFSTNISVSEIAFGVTLGMAMGFIPLNGPMAVLLFICFFVLKINKLAAMLVLPIFKLLYLSGVSSLADIVGGYLLIDIKPLEPVWVRLTHLPVFALLDLNNTLVAGGLLISGIMCLPVYILSKKGVVILRTKYFDRIKGTKFVKWFIQMPLISKILDIANSVRGEK